MKDLLNANILSDFNQLKEKKFKQTLKLTLIAYRPLVYNCCLYYDYLTFSLKLKISENSISVSNML